MEKHPTTNNQQPTSNGGKFAARVLLDVRCWLLVVGCFLSSFCRADDFGDISVDANAIYTGNTFHGYAEMRVNLQNRSRGKTHVVTLVYPNNGYGNYGNNISRLSRTVTIAPESSQVVSLLQPPLPSQGDGSIRVEVDNRHEGEVRAPNANNHCNEYSRGGQMATVFISRTLDFDAVERVFQAGRGAFTAAMATGAPDTGSGGGYQPSTWMPDTRRGGQTNWLALDYTPQAVDKIRIYCTLSVPTSGEILLTGISGTNVAHIPMSSGRTSGTGYRSGMVPEFSLPITSEPVKTVTLNFGKIPPYNIAIDAVEISGPSGNAYAYDARANSDNSASAASYAPGSVNADSVESLRAESPVSEWSENWLAYSPFDAVVLNAADLSSMSPAVLGAIGDYLQAGGNVILSGKTDLPAAWHPSQNKDLSGGAEYDVGFGRCFAFSSENLEAIDPQSVKNLRDTVREAARYWQTLPDNGGAANAVLPIVNSLKIPVRGIVVIMLAFVIIIGPVNIIYLNRRKRRTWMLWTIPAISFATTLFVFAYSLLREGITPDARIAGLTVIDQTSHHATTIGGTAFYCPLTPGGGLHFDFGTEATPLVQIGNGSGTSREVDWTQSQHFTRGWVSARVPAFFHLRKSETRRERIQVVNENGKLQVVNGLGAQIKSLWIADADMNVYHADNVDAGQKAGLILSKQSQVSEKSGAQGLNRDFGFAVVRVEELNGSAGKYLLPNSYLAVLDGNPFIENALASSSPKRTKSSAVVFGILESK
ncbi:MAG TPA: hypothetical protein VHY30_07510 [Verrucomicrobiae bacterium]|nr:hypothetical protein [Verrucomicrobiae bacterium]